MSQLNIFNTEPALTSYQKIYLDDTHYIEYYPSVTDFTASPAMFETLWQQHPAEYHDILMHGKWVKTPRWQQAYGKNYEYTGSKNNALPISDIHQKYLRWCHEKIDTRLNGLLINWYDAQHKHYIGKHRDSPKGLLNGSPIVTITHGEERIFRFRPFGGKGYTDFPVRNGDVWVIPWAANKRFTHEIPHFTKYKGRRISVTLRAYE